MGAMIDLSLSQRGIIMSYNWSVTEQEAVFILELIAKEPLKVVLPAEN